MDRCDFIKTLGVGAAAAMTAPEAFAQEAKRPNILWLSVEDIGPMHGCYGDPIAVTPFIDQLATEGVCAPSRYSIITGRYQTSDGAQHMRSGIGAGFGQLDYYTRLPEDVRFFTSYLRVAGYYCTNNSKEDYQVDKPDDAWDESSQAAH
jgi:N-sulfoglucosamine sulfohydrolase